MRRKEKALLFAATLAILAVAAFGEAPGAPGRRPKVALALEGGGALGVAHIGVLKVLESMGVPVDMVAGTSMGALVGGLYAAGYDARDIETMVEGMDWGDLFLEDTGIGRRTIRSDIRDAKSFAELEFDSRGFKSMGGLVSGRNILALFDRATLGVPDYVNFDDLPRRYRAVATDLETGRETDFSSGNLADAMRASMSFPGIFSPYPMVGRYYVDGGVVNNLPVDVAKAMGADLVIAIHIVGGSPYDKDKVERSPIDAAMRSLNQLTQANTESHLAMADLVITVDLSGYWITDFGKSAEILAKGEAAAEAQATEIAAFLAKVGGPDRNLVRRPSETPFAAVEVEGPIAERDRAEAFALFSGVVGRRDWADFLAAAARELDATRKYEAIRLGSEERPVGRTLVVRLEKKPAPGNSLRLGLVYSGYLTDAISNKLVVTPGLSLRDFPAEGSELHIDVPLFDTPGVQADFIQSLTNALDLRTSLSVMSGNENYYDTDAANYQFQTSEASSGVFLETGGLAHELLSVGWRFDWTHADDVSDIYASPSVKRASLFIASSEYRRLDHPVLPTSGLYVSAAYDLSLPSFGSERYFQTLLAKIGAYQSLGRGIAVGLKGIAGTDFSEGANDDIAAPLHYKPALSDRVLFPAPLAIDETVGAYVLGGGGDLMLLLGKPAGLVGIPVYAVLTCAAGSTVQDAGLPRDVGMKVHGNLTGGIGARLSDAFGLLLRLGVSRDSGGGVKPFLAVDIGAIPL